MLGEEAQIAGRWPVYHDALRTHTPYRSTVSLPLHEGLEGIGALDLFFVAPAGAGGLDLRDAEAVTRKSCPPSWSPPPARRGPGRARAGSTRRPPGDALALLRGYAYARDLTLDDVARRVVDRELPVHRLARDADAAS